MKKAKYTVYLRSMKIVVDKSKVKQYNFKIPNKERRPSYGR
jgi:hypothetical protein